MCSEKEKKIIPQRFPFAISLDAYPAKLMGLGLDEFFLNPVKAFEACRYASCHFGIEDTYSYFIPNVIAKDFGGEIKFSADQWPVVVNRPIVRPVDLAKFRIPHPKETFSFRYNTQFLDLCISKGKPPGIYISSIFERVAHLSGIDVILKWMRREPDSVTVLQNMILEYTLTEIEAYLELYGKEDFWVASAYSLEAQDVMSPKDFYRFCAPHILKLHQELYAKGIKHFSESLCGNHDRTLEFWVKTLELPEGTVIQIDDSADIESADAKLGDKYVLAGNISHRLFSYGTENEIFAKTLSLIRKYGNRKGGYIVAPGSGLPLNTPEQNIFAFLSAAEKVESE